MKLYLLYATFCVLAVAGEVKERDYSQASYPSSTGLAGAAQNSSCPCNEKAYDQNESKVVGSDKNSSSATAEKI